MENEEYRNRNNVRRFNKQDVFKALQKNKVPIKLAVKDMVHRIGIGSKSMTKSGFQIDNDTNISLPLLRCYRSACRGQQLFDLTSHMRNDVDQRSAKRAHSVR